MSNIMIALFSFTFDREVKETEVKFLMRYKRADTRITAGKENVRPKKAPNERYKLIRSNKNGGVRESYSEIAIR